MRVILLSLFLFMECIVLAQEKGNNFSINPIIGTRIHNNRQEDVSFAGPAQYLTTGVLGLEVIHKKYPFGITYQKDYNQFFRAHIGGEYYEPWSLKEIWEEDQIQVYWYLKHFSLGLGHYWKRIENELAHWAPGAFVTKRKGIQLSISYPTHWLDIELRTKLQYDPDFAGLVGLNHYSLLFLYRIGKKRTATPELKFLTVNGIIGARSFLHNINLIPGEEFNTSLGIAPALGIEFLFHPINLSLNLEKDWWLSFNAGSPRRDVKGLIFNSFIGIKYHHQLKNGRHLRFGLGRSWIEDNEIKLENVGADPDYINRLGNFEVKGIGVSFSYEILPHTDLEVKTTIPTIGEKIFENRSRTSLGLFYRFNPLRKKQR